MAAGGKTGYSNYWCPRANPNRKSQASAMPIQFRCTYCNQLLGIATRKAGAVVNCPTCNARVIVPRTSEPVKAGEAGTKKTAPVKSSSLLERQDFDALLKAEPVAVPAPPASTAAVPASDPGEGTAALAAAPPSSSGVVDVDVEPVAALPVTGTVLVLSPARATLLAIVIIVLLALAFLAGLFVGRSGAETAAGGPHFSPAALASR